MVTYHELYADDCFLKRFIKVMDLCAFVNIVYLVSTLT